MNHSLHIVRAIAIASLVAFGAACGGSTATMQPALTTPDMTEHVHTDTRCAGDVCFNYSHTPDDEHLAYGD